MAIVRPGTVQKYVLDVNQTLSIVTDASSSCRWGSLSPVPGSGLGANLDLPAAFVAVPVSSNITVGPFPVATAIYIDLIAGPSVNITQNAAAPLPAHAGQPLDVVSFLARARQAVNWRECRRTGQRIRRYGRRKICTCKRAQNPHPLGNW